MRNLERNKTTIKYVLYTGFTDEVDSNGLYTGTKIPTYTQPIEIKASVSASRGTTDLDLFGINVPYTHTVIVDDITCPIDENSILYINNKPYAVLLVAKSLNHISYAIRELNDREAESVIIVSG